MSTDSSNPQIACIYGNKAEAVSYIPRSDCFSEEMTYKGYREWVCRRHSPADERES
jgi:hypothetical protein